MMFEFREDWMDSHAQGRKVSQSTGGSGSHSADQIYWPIESTSDLCAAWRFYYQVSYLFPSLLYNHGPNLLQSMSILLLLPSDAFKSTI